MSVAITLSQVSSEWWRMVVIVLVTSVVTRRGVASVTSAITSVTTVITSVTVADHLHHISDEWALCVPIRVHVLMCTSLCQLARCCFFLS
jgi:hypothetical protein